MFNLLKIKHCIIDYGIRENLKVINGVVLKDNNNKPIKTKYRHFLIFIDFVFPFLRVNNTVANYDIFYGDDRLIMNDMKTWLI